MRITRVLALAALFAAACIGCLQSAETPKSASRSKTVRSTPNHYLLDLTAIVASGNKSVWSTTFNYHGRPARSNVDVIEQLKNSELSESSEVGLKAYKSQLIDMLLSAHSVDFIGDSLPFIAGTFDGKKCLVVMGATGTAYNTLRLSSKQRAATVLRANILPTLKEMAETLGETNFRCYGVYIAYGSKTFGSDDSDLQPESVGVIVSSKDVLAFAKNEMTDQSLLDKSTVLLSDRDSQDFARVKLSLD
jgi:hypothetical protein